MPMTPDDFSFYEEDPSVIPDPRFGPLPIPHWGMPLGVNAEEVRLRLLNQLSLDEATNTNDTKKVKKIKKLVKKCINLNVYIDGENVFKKILEICEGK